MSVSVDNISSVVDKSVDGTKSKVHAVDRTCKTGVVRVKEIVELWKGTTTAVTTNATAVGAVLLLLVGPVETHDGSIRWGATRFSKHV
jgi:hypothetical protein